MRRLLIVLLALGLIGCSFKNVACGVPPPPAAEAPVSTAPGTTASAPQSADPAEKPKVRIAFLGDSLTAGFGLLSNQAFPDKIQSLFAAEGYGEVESVNAGATADTTAGGLRRVEQVLEPDVRILVVALGGNDALRGLTSGQTHDNLAAIIDKARAKGLEVVVCGMEAPTNLGEDYRIAFRNVYARLRSEYPKDVVHIPFLLEGVAGLAEFNQADGIHPNEQGAQKIAEALYPKIRDLVDQLPSGGGGG